MKSKYIYVFALMLAPIFGVAQMSKPFTLTGQVSDYKRAVDQTIYLKFKQNGIEIKDSAKLINGSYTFKGLISYPAIAVIQLKVADSVATYYARTRMLKDYVHEFYMDKGKLSANAAQKLNSTVVKGSKADDDRQELKTKLDPYYAANSKAYKEEGDPAYKNKDSIGIVNYTKKRSKIDFQIDSVKKAYLFSHPQSGIALDMLREYTQSILEPAEIEPLFKQFQPEIKASDEGQAYAKRIESSKVTALGAAAPDFILKDRNGKAVSLASVKGKLVLLDFWGSWCFPCRQTHPHLRKLYAEYKDRGFEILGVANELGKPEENYKKWTVALDQDQMSWINVLNEKGEIGKLSVSEKYNVKAYPTKILIDKNGIIIKKFVGSSEAKAKDLDDMVAQILSEK
ncbi:TlpA disulfide reductase family protein [Pedobacter hiemivivus]|uniref:AhpC/TSA family protein n=1 Tax=Pedobacter hiemivivus TaxID=2530454 RepID=A0A4R0MV24_9SPHI|nr:TlpA disulfide reductase family protein [Pedobacter hiemivivus]TCC90980.1 AhpC/TSA family protein [Pedobacter hiemivivus]